MQPNWDYVKKTTLWHYRVLPLNICATRENLYEPRRNEEREGKLNFAPFASSR